MIIFCSIIVVSQLVRLSELLVNFGLSLENLLLPLLYIIVPFIGTLTIPMAYLFAVVLCFGRLSADGEYAGLLAAGYSLKRAAVPVMLLGAILYGAAAASAMNLEAWGRREFVQFIYRKTQTELDNMVKYKMQAGVFLDDFLGYVIYAEKISADRTKFENVLLSPAGDKESSFTLLAPAGSISGSVETGDLRMTFDYGVAYAAKDEGELTVVKFNRAEIDLLRIFQEQILGADSADDDYRSYTATELWQYVEVLKAKPDRDEALYLKARYLLHKRIAAPFATIVFGLFGMVLGISDPRRGKSSAYVGAILTIMAGFVVMTGFEWLSENGHLAAPAAAWLPNAILGSFGAFLVYQKHRLPPSEGTLEWHNLPFRRRFGAR